MKIRIGIALGVIATLLVSQPVAAQSNHPLHGVWQSEANISRDGQETGTTATIMSFLPPGTFVFASNEDSETEAATCIGVYTTVDNDRLMAVPIQSSCPDTDGQSVTIRYVINGAVLTVFHPDGTRMRLRRIGTQLPM